MLQDVGDFKIQDQGAGPGGTETRADNLDHVRRGAAGKLDARLTCWTKTDPGAANAKIQQK